MERSLAGLPPVAAERIERQRASGTAGSLLSAAGAAAVRAVGLSPVGEVFGCAVMNLGWTSGYCGAYGTGYQVGWGGSGQWGSASGSWAATPIVSSGMAGGSYEGFGPYVRTVERGWGLALQRMLVEAAALGADGVVGVVTRRTAMEGAIREFTATGTAVRASDPAHGRPASGQPWAAELTAEDTAAALSAGLVPRGLALGVAVSTKHEDWEVQAQRSSWSNTEVNGLTQLLQVARADARHGLTASAARLGGGDVVIDRSAVHTFESACGEARDLHAEAVFAGTVVAPAGRRRAAPPGGALTMTPVVSLRDGGARSRRRS